MSMSSSVTSTLISSQKTERMTLEVPLVVNGQLSAVYKNLGFFLNKKTLNYKKKFQW
jgi:hypothetical protein